MMNKTDIYLQLTQIIRVEVSVPAGTCLKAETRLKEDLRCDHLDEITIALGIEEGFDIQFGDSEIEAVTTIGQLQDAIADKLHVR